jgi:hypothetical protein
LADGQGDGGEGKRARDSGWVGVGVERVLEGTSDDDADG